VGGVQVLASERSRPSGTGVDEVVDEANDIDTTDPRSFVTVDDHR